MKKGTIEVYTIGAVYAKECGEALSASIKTIGGLEFNITGKTSSELFGTADRLGGVIYRDCTGTAVKIAGEWVWVA